MTTTPAPAAPQTKLAPYYVRAEYESERSLRGKRTGARKVTDFRADDYRQAAMLVAMLAPKGYAPVVVQVGGLVQDWSEFQVARLRGENDHSRPGAGTWSEKFPNWTAEEWDAIAESVGALLPTIVAACSPEPTPPASPFPLLSDEEEADLRSLDAAAVARIAAAPVSDRARLFRDEVALAAARAYLIAAGARLPASPPPGRRPPEENWAVLGADWTTAATVKAWEDLTGRPADRRSCDEMLGALLLFFGAEQVRAAARRFPTTGAGEFVLVGATEAGGVPAEVLVRDADRNLWMAPVSVVGLNADRVLLCDAAQADLLLQRRASRRTRSGRPPRRTTARRTGSPRRPTPFRRRSRRSAPPPNAPRRSPAPPTSPACATSTRSPPASWLRRRRAAPASPRSPGRSTSPAPASG